ncbi:TadA family conjugal transfer-associated ATPase [Cellulomonas endophytica]|uniref:TadA family conjugal transfer-associated ATPase n=1 Tax=Cellulomonas endophytica TaxID=2494735 RepID=UPI001F0B8105|nr:TadA family conjugal transfer-associated ATPase [Cellulomonas endophytica]
MRRAVADEVRRRLRPDAGQAGPAGPDGGPVDPDLGPAVAAAARGLGVVLGDVGAAELAGWVADELRGAGPLQPLLEDPAVTDVLVNAPDAVWVERDGRLERAPVSFASPDEVRALAVRLAALGGQRLDDAAPTVDARLPDGTRLHAVLPPVADGCALLSLRVLRRRPFDLAGLAAAGTLAPGLAPLLRALVQARASVLVSGSTGSGKTTLLAALLEAVPHDERLLVVEEAGELAPRHPHVVRLLARRPNVDGAGGVDLAELVRQALRMRPDRIVLGECRGAEVAAVMAALNTGHEGGCATVHANGAADVPARLEALGALAGLGPDAVAAQAASAFEAVLHLRRGRDGARRLVTVGVLRRGGDGRLAVRPALEVGAGGGVATGAAWPALQERLGDAWPGWTWPAGDRGADG